MAEAILRDLGGPAFDVESAGTHPGRVHPLAIETMARRGLDLSGHRSKSVDHFTGQTFDCVITVCDDADRRCPIFPGVTERIHWSIADPAAVEGEDRRREAFERAASELTARIRLLIGGGGATSSRK
jgi:arsenate reductase